MTQLMPTSPEWSARTKRTLVMAGLLGALLFLWFLRELLPLVILSGLVAYLLTPLVNFLTNRVLIIIPGLGSGARRGWSAILAFIIVIIGIIIFLLVLVPPLVSQFEDFGRSLPGLVRQVERQIERTLSTPVTFGGEPILIDGEPFIPLERLGDMTGTERVSDIIQLGEIDLTQAAQGLLGSMTSLSGPAFSFVGGAFNTIINLLFLIMIAFYLLKDGAQFVERLISMAPDGYEGDARRLTGELASVWDAYIRGQFILCVVMGISIYIAALVLGVPNAPVLGLLAGIFEFIPTLGPLLALIPAALLGLVSQSSTFEFLQGLPFALVIIVVWTGMQNIEAMFLVPRVMGNSLNLHPIVIILGVLGGAALGGALGVILAAPFIASARIFARYVYGKLTGRPAFIESDPPSPQPTWLQRLLERLIMWVRGRLRTWAENRRANDPAQAQNPRI